MENAKETKLSIDANAEYTEEWASDIARLITGHADAAGDFIEWPVSITVFHPDFGGETFKGGVVSSCPCRAEVFGEVVRIDFDSDGVLAVSDFGRHMIRDHVDKLIEGRGDMITEDFAEGFVVVSRDKWREVGCHTLPPMLTGAV